MEEYECNRQLLALFIQCHPNSRIWQKNVYATDQGLRSRFDIKGLEDCDYDCDCDIHDDGCED
jgi:hypothetical protein